MGHCRNAPSAESDTETFGWDAGKTRSVLNRISPHTGRHILGLQNNAIFAELRAEVLHDWNSNDEPARVHAALPGQPSKRPDLPKFRAQNGCGWQGCRRYSPAGDPGADRNV